MLNTLRSKHGTDLLFPASCAVLLASLLSATWLVYAPGLSGGFVFDDLGNLPSLGDYGPIDNWKVFLYYITSGIADPSGRPLAMLSFLIDANNWPADPESFKRTNILLHLLNGALLCWLLLQLGRLSIRPELSRNQFRSSLSNSLPQRPSTSSGRTYSWAKSIAARPALRTELAAVLGAGLWLLHPLWTSTTLYVVQREAMLPGTFVLLGLLAYLRGRRRISTHPASGVFWIVGVVGLCTLLGLLSKPNGILLPLFVAVIELIFIRSLPEFARPSRNLSRCLTFAIYPVVLATFAYLIYAGIECIAHGISSIRPWTLSQRLLTEPRVLLNYLGLLLAPRPYSRGLFNDSYIASQDLLRPWTTLPSLLIVAGLLAAAFAWRKRHPALALAMVFYFAGQVMESTTIPLELYFEHRNYVPAMLLFWPLALWLTGDGALARIRPLLAAGALLLLAAETYAAATLWGEQNIQALVWAAQNPDSPRAQAYASSADRWRGRYAQAENRLRHLLATDPGQIQLALNLLGVRCQQGSIAAADFATAEYALRNGSNHGLQTLDWISQAINLVRDHPCRGLTNAALQGLIDAASQNRQADDSPTWKQGLLSLEGQLALANGDNAEAERKFTAALRQAPTAELAFKQAAILGSHHLPEAGLAQLDSYRRLVARETPPAIRSMEGLHEWLLYRDRYWDKEILHLRTTLDEDVAKASQSSSMKQRDSGKVIP